MKSLIWIFKILSPFLPRIILVLLLSFSAYGSHAALMMCGAWILAKAAFMPSIAEIQVAIVAVRLFGLSRAVLRYVERLIVHQLNFSILRSSRDQLYHSVERQFPQAFTYLRSGDLLGRLVRDSHAFESLFISVLLPFATAFVASFIYIFFSMLIHPQFAWLALAYFIINLLLLPVIIYLLSKKQSKAVEGMKESLQNKAWEFAPGWLDMQQQSGGWMWTDSYKKEAELYLNQKAQQHFSGKLYQGIMGLLNVLIVILILLVWQQLPSENPQLAPVLILAYLALSELLFPLAQASAFAGNHILSLNRIIEILNGKSIDNQEDFRTEMPQKMSKLDIRDLNFSYPEGPDLLKKLNCSFKSGDRILILGESGSGKTSLIQLMLKLLPVEKSIFINGQDVSTFSSVDVRKHIAFMPQDAFFFRDGFYDNLSMYSSTCKKDEISDYLNRFQLDRLNNLSIEQADEVFKFHSDSLSGGEKQRLSFIRTLLKDADIKIFDEPGSGLDPEMIELMFNEIFKGNPDDIRIVISHQAIQTQRFTQILHLHDGQLHLQ